ncbi:MAG: hypothetical protein ACOYI4_08670 [Christensenellales bacterium]|jgi:hypothetical protein
MEFLTLILSALGFKQQQSDRFVSRLKDIYTSIFGYLPGEKKKINYLDDIADENAKVAYERQRQMQEDYLGPEAQIKSAAAGYDAVGLNRMGMVGYHPGASASTVGQSASPQDTSGNPNPAESLGTMLSALLDSKRVKNETDISKAEAEYTRSRTANQDILNKWQDRMLEAEYLNTLANTKWLGENVRNIAADTQYKEILATYAPEMLRSGIGLNDAKAAEANAEAGLSDYKKREIMSRVQANKAQCKHIDALIGKINEEILNLASDREVNDAVIAKSKAEIEKYQAEINKIAAEIGLTEKEIKFYAWNSVSSGVSNLLKGAGAVLGGAGSLFKY